MEFPIIIIIIYYNMQCNLVMYYFQFIFLGSGGANI
jgi:hypothetical protein